MKTKEREGNKARPLFRYEKKYLINQIQLETLRMRVASICETDPYTDDRGEYNIRSLYFDDLVDSGYSANEMGVEPRSKWRIRIYNHDIKTIRLEHKIKEHGKICKESTCLSPQLCRRLMEDVDNVLYPTGDRVLNKFLMECYTRGLHPRIIVEYDREAYVYDAGSVRITFDKRVCFSDRTAEFLGDDSFMVPIMAVGEQLLEVKYTEFLPGILYSILNEKNMQQNTFSKYYLARMAGKGLLV